MKKTKTKVQQTKSKILPVAIVCLITGLVIGAGLGAYFARHSFMFTELECVDGAAPDKNGCCPGEVYTDMGESGFSCCPEAGGDCFPPMRE